MAKLTGSIFKPQPVPHSNKLSQPGYDNSRENIDPHIKTKVLNAIELLIQRAKLLGKTAGSVLFLDANLEIAEDNSDLFWNVGRTQLEPNLIKITSDGTQAAPALKFNDTNIGFFKSGDSIRTSINNSTKMTVDATGVGIGVTAPEGNLNIFGVAGADVTVNLDSYGAGGGDQAKLNLRQSNTNTNGNLVTTTDGELIGSVHFVGVDTVPSFDDGAIY